MGIFPSSNEMRPRRDLRHLSGRERNSPLSKYPRQSRGFNVVSRSKRLYGVANAALPRSVASRWLLNPPDSVGPKRRPSCARSRMSILGIYLPSIRNAPRSSLLCTPPLAIPNTSAVSKSTYARDPSQYAPLRFGSLCIAPIVEILLASASLIPCRSPSVDTSE
jgi:hypothetical protein